MADKKGRVSLPNIPAAKARSSLGQVHSQALTSTSRTKNRRQSFGFSSVPGIRPMERTSQVGLEYKRPPLLYLPTYQMEPKVPFTLSKIKPVVDDMVTKLFNRHVYSTQDSPALALRIAGDLMRALKNIGFDRHRIITVCTIGQKRSQSYNNAITFLWDHERDNYYDMHIEVTTAFVQVTVFGIYFD